MTTEVLDEQKAIIEQAKAIAVKTVSDRKTATDLWDAIRAFRKKAEAQKEEVCRPLKTAWDSAKVPFDTFVRECQAHEARLQGLMSAWDREQDRLARIEQDRLQALVDKQNAKIEAKAEAKGVEPVLKVAPVVQAPAKSIETQAGTTQTRSTKKVYTPTNLTTLMKDFPQLFSLDMPKFNALAKSGMLDGRADVTITEEYIYTQRS
jgi:hypothetical protein